ncbi:MAG TPA: hypothetical protein VGF13_22875 [Verrucomicrobiae bacterium]|jgi:hypothetical protein
MPATRAVSELASAEPRLEIVSRRDLILLSALVGMFPLIVIVNFYLFVCVTRIELGHWPVFNDPFPKAMPGQGLSLIVALPAFAFPFVSLAALALAVWGRRRSADFPIGRILGLIVGSAVLLLTLAEADPGSFLNWFLD